MSERAGIRPDTTVTEGAVAPEAPARAGGRLPDFLIIGAMKAGTTTLYEDLLRTPGVYLPPEKEPNDLTHPEVEGAKGLAAYRRKFSGAGAAKAVGEASTAYAKRPDFEGVAERAVRVLGPDLKIIYMVREPVKRMVSQYHHELGLGLVAGGLNAAVLAEQRFAAYSRYDYQLEPWRRALGEAQILVVGFERYLSDRHAELARIRAFLGLSGDFPVADVRRNASAGKAVIPRGSVWARIAKSRTYLYVLKGLLPTALRDAIKQGVLPKAPQSIEPLSPETRTALAARLSEADQALYRRAAAPEARA